MSKGSGITVNGDDLSNYLTDKFIARIKPTITENRQDIGICRKPYLKYPNYKEPSGHGSFLNRKQINREYVGKNMESLNKINASKLRYIIAALLTGQALTFQQMSDLIAEKSGKNFGSVALNNAFLGLKRSRVNFLIEKVGRRPVSYRLN